MSTTLPQTREQIGPDLVVITDLSALADDIPALWSDLGTVVITPIPMFQRVSFVIRLRQPVQRLPTSTGGLVVSRTGDVAGSVASHLPITLMPVPDAGAMRLSGSVAFRLDSRLVPEELHTLEWGRQRLREFAQQAAVGVYVFGGR